MDNKNKRDKIQHKRKNKKFISQKRNLNQNKNNIIIMLNKYKTLLTRKI